MKKSLISCSKEVFIILKLVIQSAFIMRKFTIHAMKHCSYTVLSCKKKISKGLHIPKSAIAVTLKMKPGQKLCMNCIKLYQEKLNFAESSDDDKNDGHTENPDYIDQEINRTTLSDSATLLGLSPVKAVGKRDRAGYGKRKVKKIKKSLVGLVACACDIDENELLYYDSPECPKSSDLDRLIELLKEKLKMSSIYEKVKILTLAPES